ncbi:hypothetical protein ACP4OV_015254 [Aristida adscensionis]
MDATMLNSYEQWRLARRDEHVRLCAAGGEDRLSALPDDVLRLILRRLDTRSALATAALSSDVLPEGYHYYLRRRHDASGRRMRGSVVRKLDALIGRYERQGMRCLASSVRSFLDADDGEARRSGEAMSLELFPTHNSGPFNQLIAAAVGEWGVENLEVTVLNPTPRRDAGYSFPHHCFEDPTSPAGELKRLKLTKCAPLAARDGGGAPPRAFASLAVLVLHGVPRSARGRVYQRVVRACPALETLQLTSCLYRGDVSIDAPASRLAELVVDACPFRSLALRALPRLQRLACRCAPLVVTFGSVPRLAHLNLSFHDDDPSARPGRFFPGVRDELNSVLDFQSRAPGLESLAVRFTGPETWIMRGQAGLAGLRRLLLADMPRSWDALWACRLLQAARSLETLHVHVGDHDPEEGATTSGPAIPEPPLGFKHRALREVAIVGFEGTGTQLQFARFLVSTCRALESAALLKRGRVGDKGFWDWEVAVSQEEDQWSNEERELVSREIQSGGVASSALRIVLG